MKTKSKQRLIAASKKSMITAKSIFNSDYLKVVRKNIVKYASVLKELEDK